MFYKYPIEEIMSAILAGFIILFLNNSNHFIDFFSKISFSLYLTHDIIGCNLIFFTKDLFSIQNTITKCIAFSVGFIGSIVFAYLFYLFIETKAIALSKKIHYEK